MSSPLQQQILPLQPVAPPQTFNPISLQPPPEVAAGAC
jgi:hypothetical protein